MCAHHEKEAQGGYGNLTGVAWSILVMGLSLAAVIILWVWFGYIGPTFSEDVLANQQRILREHFGLPIQGTVDDPEILQTPPSLRNVSQGQQATTANNDSATSSTTTNATTTMLLLPLTILLRKVESKQAKLLREQQLPFQQDLQFKETPIMNQMMLKFH